MLLRHSMIRAFIWLSITAGIIFSACQAGLTPNATIIATIKTVLVTQEIRGPLFINVVTPTPQPVSLPDTLTICGGREPTSLYPYGEDRLAAAGVLAAVYDGPIDMRLFTAQAVILEKIPSLMDGDAIIQPVTVQPGDQMIDAYGQPVRLDPAANPKVKLIPSGSQQVVEYQGGVVSLDQLSVTFKLLPGLKWSDSASLTASDSVYAFRLLANQATPASKNTLERTASYEALDDLRVRWTGLPGYRDSTYQMNFIAPLPEHAWSKYTAIQLLSAEESTMRPLGWGPYGITEWVKGDHITLTRNPNYFRLGEGLPKFTTLIYRYFGSDYNLSLAALLAGECDVVDQTAGVEAQSKLLLALNASGKLKTIIENSLAWKHLDFGIQPVTYDDGYDSRVGDRADFFSNGRVRQAIAYCLDRPALVKDVLFDQSIIMDAYLPPKYPFFNTAVISYAYDPETGKALLAEVGWEDIDRDGVLESNGVEDIPFNTEFAINYFTDDSAQSMQSAQILARSLERCGIRVHLEYLPAQAWSEPGPEGIIQGRRFDLAQTASPISTIPGCQAYLGAQVPGPLGKSWIPVMAPYGEPQRFISNWDGENTPGFFNSNYEAACRTALYLLPGQPDYKDSLLKAQEIFAEQLPVIPLYLEFKVAASRPDLCGFMADPGTDNELWNIENFGYGLLCE